VRVAIFQFAPVVGRLQPNLDLVIAAAADAASAGAKLLVAPEMCLTGWTLRDDAARHRMASEVEEIALPALLGAAAAHALAIIVGAPIFADAHPGPLGRLANAAVLLQGDGERTDYLKMHLFGEERAWWSAGSETRVGLVDGARVGLTICYDAEFPEVPRMTRLAGAEILAIPTTNMSPYEHDQDVIFAARAIENECPVLVANRIGREGQWSYFGRSVIFDQRGQVVAQAGTAEELLVADIAPGGPADAALSYMAQRRPELYGLLVEPLSIEPLSDARDDRAAPIT
jgi:predicted amidohydrolase